MNLKETKVVVAVLFGLLRFAFGLLPIQICAWLKRKASDKDQPPLHDHPVIQHGLMLAECFSGGVFFAACFLYMIPAVNHAVDTLITGGILNSGYPYAQLIVSLGFFLIYFLEEFCHWLVSITPKTPFKCDKFRRDRAIVKQAEIESDAINSEKESPEPIPDDVSEASSETEALNELFEVEVRTNQQVLRCALIALALSLHSLFEGVAVGLQHDITDIWYIFTAISIHSAVRLFHVGLLIFLRGVTIKGIIVRMFILAFSTPLGVLIGLLISAIGDGNSNGLHITDVVLEGVSTGTILYITFIEILGKEKERRICRRYRAFIMGAGFGFMAGLVCITYY